MKYKVSNVCQVLDKSKYPATTTVQGVTYTNNGDGTVTVNGTSTDAYYSNYQIPIDIKRYIPGHKYAILSTGIQEDTGTANYPSQIVIADFLPGKYYYNGPNIIAEFPEYEGTVRSFRWEIRVNRGITVTNLVCKPQLFDLTEMYGAGHEPTTVAQFRQDFPNEYYEYSPECWKNIRRLKYVTGPYQPYGYLEMKRGKYVTETNNLFAPSTTTGNAGDFSNTTVRNFEENVWYIGLTRNNYNNPGVVYIHEIKDNYIKVATAIAAYGVARAFRVSPNKQYTLSFKGNLIKGGVGFGFYDNTGKYLSMTDSVFTITTPANCGWLTIVLGGYPTNTEQYCTDLQLVEGSTATPYQPYRHIAFK